MAKRRPKVNKKRLALQRALRVKYEAKQKVDNGGMEDVNKYFSALIDDFDDKLRPFDGLSDIDDKIAMLKQIVIEDGDTDRVAIIDSRMDDTKMIDAVREAQSRNLEIVIVE